MESAPIRFTVEMADVPFEIRCFYPETKENLKDFLTEKKPEFVIDMYDKSNAGIRRDVERFVSLYPEDYADQSEVEVAKFVEESSMLLLVARWLSKYGVLLLHGSAVCLDGWAYIFTAPSGTGKSTHTALWHKEFGDRVWMINGDKPFVRLFEDGSVNVYGSPWMGKEKLGRNSSAPLKAIAWLIRGKENRIRQEEKSKAFSLLVTQIYKSFDKEWVSATFKHAKKLLEAVPFYRLECNMDPDAARVAAGTMSSGEFR